MSIKANFSLSQDEQDREKKKTALIEKRQQVEAKWQTIQQWEEELVSAEVRDQMKHMPEVNLLSITSIGAVDPRKNRKILGCDGVIQTVTVNF